MRHLSPRCSFGNEGAPKVGECRHGVPCFAKFVYKGWCNRKGFHLNSAEKIYLQYCNLESNECIFLVEKTRLLLHLEVQYENNEIDL